MKDELFSFITISALIAAFAIISVMVYLSRGNKKLISQKLKLGALILSLTTIISTGCDDQITCYEPSPRETVEIDAGNIDSTGRLILLTGNKIKGKILYRTSAKFSFKVNDTLRQASHSSGNIEALDGVYNESTEEFEISVNHDIQNGIYSLLFFNYNLSETDGQNPLNEFRLKVEK